MTDGCQVRPRAITYAKELPNLDLVTTRAPMFEIATAAHGCGPGKVIRDTDSPFVTGSTNAGAAGLMNRAGARIV